MFSFFSKNKPFIGAIYSIGSSSVGGSLVCFEPGKVPKVIFTLREFIPKGDHQDYNLLFGRMIETLKLVNLRLSKEGLHHLKFTNLGNRTIKKVFCVFSMPWAESRAHMISVDGKGQSFLVTEQYVKNIVAQEEKIFEDQIKADNQIHNISGEEYVSLGKDVIQIKINGYELEKPFGKEAKSLDVAFFVSLVPKSVVEKVEEILARSHHLKELRSFTFSVAAFSVIRDVLKYQKDFMYVDIAGEFTEVAVAKDGVVVEHSSFPLGRSFLVRKIMESMKEPYEIAVSILEAYFANHLDDDLNNRVSEIVNSAKTEWAEYINKALVDISSRVLLPRSVLLIVGDFIPFFIKIIKEQKIGMSTIGNMPFEVELLDYDSLRAHISIPKGVKADYFLTLETVFINKTLDK